MDPEVPKSEGPKIMAQQVTINLPVPVVILLGLGVIVVTVYYAGLFFGGALVSLAATIVTVWTEHRMKLGQLLLSGLAVLTFAIAAISTLDARSTQRELESKVRDLGATSNDLLRTQRELGESKKNFDKLSKDFETIQGSLKKAQEVFAQLVERVSNDLDQLADVLDKRGTKRAASEVRAVREKVKPYPPQGS